MDDAEYAHHVRTLEWSQEQLAAMDRAERLRYYGASDAAADLVARECAFPHWFRYTHVPEATRLDVGRWYSAFVGKPWDGALWSFRNAKNNATRRRQSPLPAVPTQPWIPTSRHLGVHAYRSCHLLVEPLDAHSKLQELRDYTRLIGWHAVSNVGHLSWNATSNLVCAFCDSLLLPSEADPIRDASGLVCGQHCCSKGLDNWPTSLNRLLSMVCRSNRVMSEKSFHLGCPSTHCGCDIFGWVGLGVNMARTASFELQHASILDRYTMDCRWLLR